MHFMQYNCILYEIEIHCHYDHKKREFRPRAELPENSEVDLVFSIRDALAKGCFEKINHFLFARSETVGEDVPI